MKSGMEFTHEVETPEGEAVLGGIVQLGRSLGLPIVAEGIERSAQRDLVTRSMCDHGQGYLFARPQAPERIAKWISAASLPDPDGARLSVGRSGRGRNADLQQVAVVP